MSIWIQIPETDWEYDLLSYENLPQSRKQFWDDQGEQISHGIRTSKNGNQVYLRVRKIDLGGLNYYESELNKTYYDKYYGTLSFEYLTDSGNKIFVSPGNKILVRG